MTIAVYASLAYVVGVIVGMVNPRSLTGILLMAAFTTLNILVADKVCRKRVP